MLGAEKDCIEHLLEEISTETKSLKELQAKIDEQKRLFADLAVASRLKVESRTRGTYRNWPIECDLKVVPLTGNSQRVEVCMKNKLNVALDRWKLLLDVHPLALFVGHSEDSEFCIHRYYSSGLPFLAGGAESRHEFRIDDPFDGTAVVFDLFLLKAFDPPADSIFKVQISSHVIHLFDLMVGPQETGSGSRLLVEQFRCFQYSPTRSLSIGRSPSSAACSVSLGDHLFRSLRSGETPGDFMLRLFLPTLLTAAKNSNGSIDVPLNHFNALHVRSVEEPGGRRVRLEIEASGFDSNVIVNLFMEAALWRTWAFLSSPEADISEGVSPESVAREVEFSVTHAPSAERAQPENQTV